MQDFRNHVSSIRELAAQVRDGQEQGSLREMAEQAVTCDVSEVLRRSLPRNIQRRQGAFFTPPALADYMASKVWLGKLSSVFDPSFGSGELLLAAARRMVASSQWNNSRIPYSLHGVELNSDYIDAAKARLGLYTALHRVGTTDWSQLRHSNFLFDGVPHQVPKIKVLMNPPFGYTRAQESCAWAKGQVSAAAIFVEHALSTSPLSTEVVALLPDVLRSGSRYERWRKRIEGLASWDRIEMLDRFDRSADVHVFLVKFRTRVCRTAQQETSYTLRDIVSDQFDVRVGPLVDYREKNTGQWHKYICVDTAPRWGTVCAEQDLPSRRFRGTVFPPPFVVVRRTSRPEDEARIVPTLITGKRDVAVENHLLVLWPRDRRVRTCHRIIEYFGRPCASQWMDTRIRCRHLTVRALSEMPYE